MDILLIIAVVVVVVAVLGSFSKEHFDDDQGETCKTNKKNYTRNTFKTRMSTKDCVEYANDKCTLDLNSTRTNTQFPKELFKSSQPKTIGVQCWNEAIRCCKLKS